MLYSKLQQLAQSDVYPFHMPGHKRRLSDFPNPYAIDITEIEGFDDLHHARGVLKEEQERAAALYGSKKCFYLVNGSTCGILAAISAAVRPGERILVARNCHKSVYHALYLRRLRPVYVYPVPTRRGLLGQIRAEDVAACLAEYPDIRAVVLTSPTYDGIVSDVAAIAEAAHERGLLLIVDEAHGAHLGFHEAFPENAIPHADAVVMSVHKTLPALTQTALLHLCSERIAASSVERFLDIYESSSPSYVLMAGISRCVQMLSEPNVHELFAAYAKRLSDFRERMKGLRQIKVLGAEHFSSEEAFAFDIGKLILDTGDSGMTGTQLAARLLEDYHLQTEMEAGGYVLAMTSLMDTEEGFGRLAAALEELDAVCGKVGGKNERPPAPTDIYRRQRQGMELWQTAEAEQETLPLADAAGRICADTIGIYPPGIPVLVPGEFIGEQTLFALMNCRRLGLDIEGLVGTDAIRVVKLREM